MGCGVKLSDGDSSCVFSPAHKPEEAENDPYSKSHTNAIFYLDPPVTSLRQKFNVKKLRKFVSPEYL